MTNYRDEHDDDVPRMAVEAMDAAYRRARAEGRTIVVVRDGMLIRQTPDGETVMGKVSAPSYVPFLDNKDD